MQDKTGEEEQRQREREKRQGHTPDAPRPHGSRKAGTPACAAPPVKATATPE